MYIYILGFPDKKEFLSLDIPADVVVVAEDGGLGTIPMIIESVDIETGMVILEEKGNKEGWFCNVYSNEPLPKLEPYILNPLPVMLRNSLAGQDDKSIVESP